MAISLIVQNQNHKVLERITAGLADLGNFAMNLPNDEGLLLRGIHLYGDTYFNMVQLRFLVEEVGRLGPRYPEKATMLEVIAAAAQEAIRNRGYLLFVGD